MQHLPPHGDRHVGDGSRWQPLDHRLDQPPRQLRRTLSFVVSFSRWQTSRAILGDGFLMLFFGMMVIVPDRIKVDHNGRGCSRVT